MAEISVEKKRGMGWLLWLLAIILLVLLLWWLFADRDAAGVERTRVGTDIETETGPIRDAAMLFSVAEPMQVTGRQVELQNARVLNVTNDRTFWVGEGEGRQVLVRMDQPAAQNIAAGQTVNVYGDVRAFPGWEAARTEWNAPTELQTNFENQKVYVHANRVDMSTP